MSDAPSFVDIWSHGDLVCLGANKHLPGGARLMHLIASYPTYSDALSAALPYIERGWSIRDDVRGATIASLMIEGGSA